MTQTAPQPSAAEASWHWVLPGRHGSPAEVMQRLRAICEQVPDLFDALLLLLGTHQALPRDILAAATKNCRADLQDLSAADVGSLYVAIANGGRQGFDAVLRARRKGGRSAALGAWVKE